MRTTESFSECFLLFPPLAFVVSELMFPVRKDATRKYSLFVNSIVRIDLSKSSKTDVLPGFEELLGISDINTPDSVFIFTVGQK